MKPAPFDYFAPESVEEAVDRLADAAGDAVILAGGQTLLPLLALRMSTPSVIVDINRIADLQGIAADSRGVRIGAGTRQKAALTDATIAADLPLIAEAVGHVGHLQTRARGTIGGSVANGEPAAEMPATALALGASVEVRSQDETRTIPLDEFYFGPYATALDYNELVTAIHYPALPAGATSIFREITRRPGDFALVGLVGYVAADAGKVSAASFAWFGMGPTPMKAQQAADALVGTAVGDVDPAAIADLAIADSDPFDDHHASAYYRRTVGRRIFADALRQALLEGVPA